MSQCRSPNCRAEIHWIVMASGSRMPVDAQPDPQGLVLVCAGRGLMLDHPADPAELQPGESTHTSHFATCPDADKHRRRPQP